MEKINQIVNEWETIVIEYDNKSRGFLRQLRPELASISDNETDKIIDELSKFLFIDKIFQQKIKLF